MACLVEMSWNSGSFHLAINPRVEGSNPSSGLKSFSKNSVIIRDF